MKLAIFAVLLMVGLALAVPVAEEPKDLEAGENKAVEPQQQQEDQAPADDLKTDASYWGGGWGYRPYYGGSYYRPWGYGGYGGYGHGYYGGYRRWGGGYGGWGYPGWGYGGYW